MIKMYAIHKNKIIIVLVLLLLFISYKSINYITHRNVIGCTNSHVSTDFEKWCENDLESGYVPAYIIIKDGKVTNVKTGLTTNFEFKKLLRTDRMNVPLYKEKVKDLNGKTYYLKEFDVVEIVMLDCPACQEQQKKNSVEIHKKNHLKFLTYYVFSERSEVKKELNRK